MGIDARVITGAVEKHYKDLFGPANISGYEYLDKIIQIPFRIPEPNAEDLKRFLEKQMGRGEPTLPKEPTQRNLSSGPDAVAGLRTQEESATAQVRSSGLEPGERKRIGLRALKIGVSWPSSGEKDPKHYKVTASTPPRFGDAEVAAFRALAPYLRPNPRHVKRLVNVYVLVRSLRQQQHPTEPLPAAALVRWLVMCGQWPYTCHEILERFDEIERKGDGDNFEKYEQIRNDPLGFLYEQVRPKLNPLRRQKLDYNLDVFERLLLLSEGRPSWEELKLLRQYTINFNPAVSSEMRDTQPEKGRPAATSDN
jgi:hypothetical protein